MFGRSRKCRFCGAKEGLSTCSCGKHYCPLHGVGGQCTECYSSGLIRHTETVTRMPDDVVRGKRKKEKRDAKKAEVRSEKGIPKAGSRIKFEPIGSERLLGILKKGLRAHHFIGFAQRRVAVFDSDREIEVLFHGDRVLNSILCSDDEISLTTDLRRITPKAMEKLDVNHLGDFLNDLPQGRDAYRSLLHHNEISWLLQAVVLSLGAEVNQAELEWRLPDLPVRSWGPMCPWCGTSVAAQGNECRFCNREIPRVFPTDDFIRRHLKRQFNDKLVGIRSLRSEGEISPEEYREGKARLNSLLESVDRVRWGTDLRT